MKRSVLGWMLVAGSLAGQTVKEVRPANAAMIFAPEDGVRLFDGSGLQNWAKEDGSDTGCKVEKDEMVCRTGAKDAFSRVKHRDAQLHIEFLVPKMPDQKGQRKGNSGVFLMGCYEAQILDGINNPTYANGTVGSLYGFSAPLVNAARPAGEWQSYDIFFTAPKCDAEGKVTEVARATVLLNGVLVQNHTPMDTAKMACRIKKQNLCEAGPIILQDHSGFPNPPETEMRFRNIWLRMLDR
jgi:hypothetical protein